MITDRATWHGVLKKTNATFAGRMRQVKPTFWIKRVADAARRITVCLV